jgi:hypothetical protein
MLLVGQAVARAELAAAGQVCCTSFVPRRLVGAGDISYLGSDRMYTVQAKHRHAAVEL